MRACWRKSSKALAQNTGFLDGGYHGGGVNNRQSPSSVFHFALFRGEGLSDHAAEGDGAAAAVAGRHIRIRVGIVRTRVDARDVQAFNRLAIVVDSLEVFVNRNAVERAQHVARSANAIERRRANCRQAMRVFSEIGVDARVVILILALDGLLQRFGRQAKAFRKLLNGIGHHDIAILDQAFVDALGSFERHIGRCVVVEGENARTAMDVELLEVLLVIGVPNVYHGVAGLGQSRIQNVVVRRRLVGEALAVQVDLQPGVGAHPEQGAGGFRSAELVGLNRDAVEHHRRVNFVHVRAGIVAYTADGNRLRRIAPAALYLTVATIPQRNRMVAQDLAVRLLEAAEARSHSPNAK